MVKVCVLSAFLVIYFLSAFGKELNNVTRKRYKDVRRTMREWLFYHYYPISFDDLNVFFFSFLVHISNLNSILISMRHICSFCLTVTDS